MCRVLSLVEFLLVSWLFVCYVAPILLMEGVSGV